MKNLRFTIYDLQIGGNQSTNQPINQPINQLIN